MDVNKQVFSQKEAAEYLGLCERTVQDMRLRGEIKFKQPIAGKRVFIRREELDRWLNEQS